MGILRLWLGRHNKARVATFSAATGRSEIHKAKLVLVQTIPAAAWFEKGSSKNHPKAPGAMDSATSKSQSLDTVQRGRVEPKISP
jgi:hypothetical protein